MFILVKFAFFSQRNSPRNWLILNYRDEHYIDFEIIVVCFHAGMDKQKMSTKSSTKSEEGLLYVSENRVKVCRIVKQ